MMCMATQAVLIYVNIQALHPVLMRLTRLIGTSGNENA